MTTLYCRVIYVLCFIRIPLRQTVPQTMVFHRYRVRVRRSTTIAVLGISGRGSDGINIVLSYFHQKFRDKRHEPPTQCLPNSIGIFNCTGKPVVTIGRNEKQCDCRKYVNTASVAYRLQSISVFQVFHVTILLYFSVSK